MASKIDYDSNVVHPDGREAHHERALATATAFRDHVEAGDFPCVGAKAALGRDQATVYVGRSMESAWDDISIAQQLGQFAREYKADPQLFLTFIALFPDTPPMDEERYEEALWTRIASLQAKDDWLGQSGDARVSGDPGAANFSLSFGGEGFFVVGMHPGASREARRSSCAAMVFNLHDQFERLRAEGRYEKLRANILERDVALAGSVNPMLARHGEESEARQYSGRVVGPDWQCPWPGRKD